jgi:hypothetical protein
MGRIQGDSGVYTPFRNDFVPLSFANLLFPHTMEGTKKCPIYPCNPSLKLIFKQKSRGETKDSRKTETTCEVF